MAARRSGTSGPMFEPGGGAVLGGDAAGPAAANFVHSLSEFGGGVNHVPIIALVPGVADKPLMLTPGGTIAAQELTIPDSAFDFVFRTRAQIIAAFPPAAGVITLPSGSYAFAETIALDPAERIAIAAAARVYFWGPGERAQLQFDVTNADLVTVPANSRLEVDGLDIVNTGVVGASTGWVINAEGWLRARGCFWSAARGGVLRALDRVQVVGCFMFTDDATSRVVLADSSATGRSQNFVQTSMFGSTADGVPVPAFESAAQALNPTTLVACEIQGNKCVGTRGSLTTVGCRLNQAGETGWGVAVLDTTSVLILDSCVLGSAGDASCQGLQIAGGVAGKVQLSNCVFEAWSNECVYVDNILVDFIMSGNRMTSDPAFLGTVLTFGTAPTRYVIIGNILSGGAGAFTGTAIAAPNFLRANIHGLVAQTESVIV